MVPTFLKFDHWFGEGHFAQRIHFLRNYPLLHDFRVSRRGETRMRARVMPCTLLRARPPFLLLTSQPNPARRQSRRSPVPHNNKTYAALRLSHLALGEKSKIRKNLQDFLIEIDPSMTFATDVIHGFRRCAPDPRWLRCE